MHESAIVASWATTTALEGDPNPKKSITQWFPARPATDNAAPGASPLPPLPSPCNDVIMAIDMLAELGGERSIRTLVDGWYGRVLADPLLVPLFGTGEPYHVDHLTAFLVEVFGGPTRYTEDLGGFPTLLGAHRGLAITEDQRQRFVELFLGEFDRQQLGDAVVRAQFADYLAFGTEVAVVNSHATGDADLHPCQEVPRWPDPS